MTTPAFDIESFRDRHADLLPKVGRLPAVASRPTVAAVAPWSQPGAFSDVDELTEKTFRASRYLANMAPSIPGQNGHGQCFDAACTLVKGYDLAPHEARPILAEWNQRCQPPWTDAELDHKLSDADKKPDDKPRGYLFREHREASGKWELLGHVDEGQGLEPGADFSHLEAPQATARVIKNAKFSHAGIPTLRKHADEYYVWQNGAFTLRSSEWISDEVSEFVQDEITKEFSEACTSYGMRQYGRGQGGKESEQGGKGSERPKERPLTRGFVANAVQALGAQVRTNAEACPAWLDGDGVGWNPLDVLPMRNNLVHIPSYLDGKPCTRKPTPLFFATHCIGYDWPGPNAAQPTQWLKFLDDVFPSDEHSQNLLQEWFGLQLVPVTRYQKALALIGPPRSGKGTIAATMKAMIGEHNYCGPTLGAFSETFGMQTLPGKLAAVIDDARLSGKSDQATIMERLLSIIGEGHLDVRRMYRPQWSGVLSCRITLISNEFPRFSDPSNALINRFHVLEFTKSNLGKEDTTLRDKFKAELPGILLWSIEGLRRLKARGHFIQPESSKELHDEMKSVSSPTACFVAERCRIGRDEMAEKSALYNAWNDWCKENGRKDICERNVFFRNLRSVVPGLKTSQPTVEGKRLTVSNGIRLLKPEELHPADELGLSSVDFGDPPPF